MGSKINLIIVLIGLFAVNIESNYIKSDIASHANLLKFMSQNRDLTVENPERSIECFGYYIPILNKIADDYEINYGTCVTAANYSHNIVDESTQEQRQTIESSSTQACQLLYNCKQYESSIDYFECYENGGTVNSRTMYTISVTASDVLFDVRERYQVIENDFYRCTNASERLYLEETGSTYDEMQNCILGLSPVPTNAPESPETDEPTTTTPAEVDTDAPETENPEARKLTEDVHESNFIVENMEKFKRTNNKFNLQRKLGKY